MKNVVGSFQSGAAQAVSTPSVRAIRSSNENQQWDEIWKKLEKKTLKKKDRDAQRHKREHTRRGKFLKVKRIKSGEQMRDRCERNNNDDDGDYGDFCNLWVVFFPYSTTIAHVIRWQKSLSALIFARTWFCRFYQMSHRALLFYVDTDTTPSSLSSFPCEMYLNEHWCNGIYWYSIDSQSLRGH